MDDVQDKSNVVSPILDATTFVGTDGVVESLIIDVPLTIREKSWDPLVKVPLCDTVMV